MIRLEVRDYCAKCFDFEACVQGPDVNVCIDGTEIVTDTIIRCKNRTKCEHLRRYLEENVLSVKRGGYGK